MPSRHAEQNIGNSHRSMLNVLKNFWTGLDSEAWLRFFMAVAGLALAFTAAVFSSAARDAGNTTATAIFASLALLLSGLVSVTTVPYLARRVVATRVREALHYELTREGMAYLGMALVIGIAALNTGNNLLFIVLAAMLAAIVVSGLASAAVLRGLELEVLMPRNAFAGRAVAVHVRVSNPRLWFPAFSVKVMSPPEEKEKEPGLGVAKDAIHLSQKAEMAQAARLYPAAQSPACAQAQGTHASGLFSICQRAQRGGHTGGAGIPASRPLLAG